MAKALGHTCQPSLAHLPLPAPLPPFLPFPRCLPSSRCLASSALSAGGAAAAGTAGPGLEKAANPLVGSAGNESAQRTFSGKMLANVCQIVSEQNVGVADMTP